MGDWPPRRWAWQRERQRIADDGRRKQAEAAKAQPRNDEGEFQPVVNQNDLQPVPKTLPGQTAKAKASKTNTGAVARGDVLVAQRPDLAKQVQLGEGSHRAQVAAVLVRPVEAGPHQRTLDGDAQFPPVAASNPWPLVRQRIAAEANRKRAEAMEGVPYAPKGHERIPEKVRVQKEHGHTPQEPRPGRAAAAASGVRAEMRMADEIDAGQERGEVARKHDNQHTLDVRGPDNQSATLDELGVSRQRLHEWREMRDAGGVR